jgi:hypothetical protein
MVVNSSRMAQAVRFVEYLVGAIMRTGEGEDEVLSGGLELPRLVSLPQPVPWPLFLSARGKEAMRIKD